jgi:hypothetical protein
MVVRNRSHNLEKGLLDRRGSNALIFLPDGPENNQLLNATEDVFINVRSYNQVKPSSRLLLVFGASIGVLVIVALVLVLTMPTPETRLLPEDTPEGIVQILLRGWLLLSYFAFSIRTDKR